MHITIEKTLGIAISLSLCAGLGVPLINLGLNVITDYQNYSTAVDLMDRINHGINIVWENNTDFLDRVVIPQEFNLWSENQSIFCQYAENDNAIIRQTYSFDIIITSSIGGGEKLIYIFKEGEKIFINFIEPMN